MDIFQDWEYEYSRDQIYAMERQHQVELEWQQWEEDQANKKIKSAVIKVLTPKKYEVSHNTSSIRGTHQEKL